MRQNTAPKDIHPKIAKIVQEFAEEIGLEIELEVEEEVGDIDDRLMHYSKEYIEYKPGVVKDTTKKN